ncbi:hypothetical protein GCM10023237_00520 [Streptomyces coeruleoprunus]
MGQARRFLQRCLNQWKLPALTQNATLVVSELSTNAIRHTAKAPHSPVWLAVFLYTDELICAVSDPSPNPPHKEPLEPYADAGRGLHVVTALTSSWGWNPAPPPGKIVWASLPIRHH